MSKDHQANATVIGKRNTQQSAFKTGNKLFLNSKKFHNVDKDVKSDALSAKGSFFKSTLAKRPSGDSEDVATGKGHKIKIKTVFQLPSTHGSSSTNEVYDPFSPTEDDVDSPPNVAQGNKEEEVYDPFNPTYSDDSDTEVPNVSESSNMKKPFDKENKSPQSPDDTAKLSSKEKFENFSPEQNKDVSSELNLNRNEDIDAFLEESFERGLNKTHGDKINEVTPPQKQKLHENEEKSPALTPDKKSQNELDMFAEAKPDASETLTWKDKIKLIVDKAEQTALQEEKETVKLPEFHPTQNNASDSPIRFKKLSKKPRTESTTKASEFFDDEDIEQSSLQLNENKNTDNIKQSKNKHSLKRKSSHRSDKSDSPTRRRKHSETTRRNKRSRSRSQHKRRKRVSKSRSSSHNRKISKSRSRSRHKKSSRSKSPKRTRRRRSKSRSPIRRRRSRSKNRSRLSHHYRSKSRSPKGRRKSRSKTPQRSRRSRSRTNKRKLKSRSRSVEQKNRSKSKDKKDATPKKSKSPQFALVETKSRSPVRETPKQEKLEEVSQIPSKAEDKQSNKMDLEINDVSDNETIKNFNLIDIKDKVSQEKSVSPVKDNKIINSPIADIHNNELISPALKPELNICHVEQEKDIKNLSPKPTKSHKSKVSDESSKKSKKNKRKSEKIKHEKDEKSSGKKNYSSKSDEKVSKILVEEITKKKKKKKQKSQSSDLDESVKVFSDENNEAVLPKHKSKKAKKKKKKSKQTEKCGDNEVFNDMWVEKKLEAKSNVCDSPLSNEKHPSRSSSPLTPKSKNERHLSEESLEDLDDCFTAVVENDKNSSMDNNDVIDDNDDDFQLTKSPMQDEVNVLKESDKEMEEERPQVADEVINEPGDAVDESMKEVEHVTQPVNTVKEDLFDDMFADSPLDVEDNKKDATEVDIFQPQVVAIEQEKPTSPIPENKLEDAVPSNEQNMLELMDANRDQTVKTSASLEKSKDIEKINDVEKLGNTENLVGLAEQVQEEDDAPTEQRSEDDVQENHPIPVIQGIQDYAEKEEDVLQVKPKQQTDHRPSRRRRESHRSRSRSHSKSGRRRSRNRHRTKSPKRKTSRGHRSRSADRKTTRNQDKKRSKTPEKKSSPSRKSKSPDRRKSHSRRSRSREKRRARRSRSRDRQRFSRRKSRSPRRARSRSPGKTSTSKQSPDRRKSKSRSPRRRSRKQSGKSSPSPRRQKRASPPALTMESVTLKSLKPRVPAVTEPQQIATISGISSTSRQAAASYNHMDDIPDDVPHDMFSTHKTALKTLVDNSTPHLIQIKTTATTQEKEGSPPPPPPPAPKDPEPIAMPKESEELTLNGKEQLADPVGTDNDVNGDKEAKKGGVSAILNFIGINPQQQNDAKNAILSITEISKRLQLDKIVESGDTNKVAMVPDESKVVSPISIDNIESSAVELFNKDKKDKYVKKMQFRDKVVEEAKSAIKPFYEKREINKEEYKDIMKRAVNKICSTEAGSFEVNNVKIRRLIRRYIEKYQERNHKKKEKMRIKLDAKHHTSDHTFDEEPPSPPETYDSINIPVSTPTLLKKEPRKVVTLPDLPLPPPPPPPKPRAWKR